MVVFLIQDKQKNVKLKLISFSLLIFYLFVQVIFFLFSIPHQRARHKIEKLNLELDFICAQIQFDLLHVMQKKREQFKAIKL